jgi:2-dehydropantoate 2-reductase
MLAARLVRAGYETSALARPERAARINAHGITLQSSGDTFTVPLRASADANALGPQDVVFVTTKYTNLAEIALQLPALCGAETPLVFWLNGVPWWFFQGFGGPHAGTKLLSVDPDGFLERSIPLERVVWCAVEVGAAEETDGTVLHKMSNLIYLGRPNNSLQVTEDVAALLRAAGYDAHATADIRQALWSKLQANMAMNPVSALTLADTRDTINDPLVYDLLVSILNESRAISDALGLAPGFDYAPLLKQNAPKMQAGGRSSMAQDVMRNRPIEAEAILGAPVEIADRIGVPVPTTRTLYALLRARAKVLASKIDVS